TFPRATSRGRMTDFCATSSCREWTFAQDRAKLVGTCGRSTVGWCGGSVHMDQDQPNFDGVALDRTTVAQELLNIDNKQRSNLFPWNGQFSPQLIEVLLRTYAPKNGLVLDPFAGSGTVLCEAGGLGMPVVGAEISRA